MIMMSKVKTRNTFLEFLQPAEEEAVPKLRRASTDPCLLSPRGEESATPPKNELKIFVGSLPAQCDEPCLTHFMSYFGTVDKVSIKRNMHTGQSRRYGYVKFTSPPNAEIFDQTWMLGDKAIRIKRYEVNPCWKNTYMSDNDDSSGQDEGNFK